MRCQHQPICSSASDVDSKGARLSDAPWDLSFAAICPAMSSKEWLCMATLYGRTTVYIIDESTIDGQTNKKNG